MSDMLRVVAGLAMRGDTVLMGLRKTGKKRGGLWEVPGGKVEKDESLPMALQREWAEELDLTAVNVKQWICSSYLKLEVSFVVDLFHVTIPDDAIPKAIDHEEVRWVNLHEAIQYMPCSPAMYYHYAAVSQWMAGL